MQTRFYKHYLATPIAERSSHASALAAGYAPRSAKSTGSRLLTHPAIRKAILEEDVDRRIEITHVNDAWMLQEAANLWDTSLGALFAEDGTLQPIHEMSSQAQKLVAGFKIRTTREVVYGPDGEIDHERGLHTEVAEIKLVNRLQVLDMIGRHTRVNAFGDKEKSEAAGAFADLLRVIGSVVAGGGAIDVELINTLIGDSK